MVALSASRFVWPAIPVIMSTTSPILRATSERWRTFSMVTSARFTASSAIVTAVATCVPIS
jgi:hypothetical protein